MKASKEDGSALGAHKALIAGSRKKLLEAAKTAETLVKQLDEIRCEQLDYQDHRSCLKVERERRWRGNLRPTHYMDPKRLCQSCAASWFATRASIQIDGYLRTLPSPGRS